VYYILLGSISFANASIFIFVSAAKYCKSIASTRAGARFSAVQAHDEPKHTAGQCYARVDGLLWLEHVWLIKHAQWHIHCALDYARLEQLAPEILHWMLDPSGAFFMASNMSATHLQNIAAACS
jgi:hypothetical protein